MTSSNFGGLTPPSSKNLGSSTPPSLIFSLRWRILSLEPFANTARTRKTGRFRSYRWGCSSTAKAFRSRYALIPVIPIALPSMPGREIFAGKSKRSRRPRAFGGIRQSLGKCFLGGNARGDGLPAETSKKGLTGNCVTHIIRLRELYYSHSTVCDEVLQYLFM